MNTLDAYNAPQSNWLVGASYRGTGDQTPRFLNEGIWENGYDDKHLDFRIAVDVAKLEGARRQITATTLVRSHNHLGRLYLAAVLPFHRVIVPAMLTRAGED